MRFVEDRKIPNVLAAVLLLVFFLTSFTAMQRESDTWDEGMAIASDALRILNGDWRVADYSPPLHTWLNAPAIHFLKPTLPPQGFLAGGELYYGRAFLYLYNDAWSLLLLSRLSVLAVACVMGIFLYRWSARMGGPWAGVLALFLMAFEPNLLTHSRIAAWDMLCTATMFIAAYFVWSWLEASGVSWRRAILSGLALGLAFISKYTALILIPSLISAIPVYLLMKDQLALRPNFSSRIVVQAVGGMAVAAGVVVFSYAPDYDLAHYFRGMSQIYSMGVPPDSYQYYLLGRIYDQPVWYYYAMTFLMKTPLPLLVLIGLQAIFRNRESLSPRHDAFVLCPVIWMLVTAAFDPYNVCLRRILPVYPFLILYASQAIGLRAPLPIRRFAAVLLCGWTLWIGIRTYPDHLSYFNEAFGGPSAGIRRLDECNVDWGQGLARLADYLKKHGVSEVRMAPEEAGEFGRAVYYGIRHHPIGAVEYLEPKPAVYALSAHRVVWLKKQARRFQDPRWDWMERFRPAGLVGHSVYIYDFRPPRTDAP